MTATTTTTSTSIDGGGMTTAAGIDRRLRRWHRIADRVRALRGTRPNHDRNVGR